VFTEITITACCKPTIVVALCSEYGMLCIFKNCSIVICSQSYCLQTTVLFVTLALRLLFGQVHWYEKNFDFSAYSTLSFCYFRGPLPRAKCRASAFLKYFSWPSADTFSCPIPTPKLSEYFTAALSSQTPRNSVLK
jgi:hypothetical protein